MKANRFTRIRRSRCHIYEHVSQGLCRGNSFRNDRKNNRRTSTALARTKSTPLSQRLTMINWLRTSRIRTGTRRVAFYFRYRLLSVNTCTRIVTLDETDCELHEPAFLWFRPVHQLRRNVGKLGTSGRRSPRELLPFPTFDSSRFYCLIKFSVRILFIRIIFSYLLTLTVSLLLEFWW